MGRRTHNQSGTRLCDVWYGIKARCYNPKHMAYANYGGRGIAVCQEWLDSPSAFFAWAYGAGYREGLCIERIDNDAGYSPANCAWVTRSRQARNKRNNIWVELFGERKALHDWIDDPRTAVGKSTVYYRIRNGWSYEDALTTPPKTGPRHCKFK